MKRFLRGRLTFRLLALGLVILVWHLAARSIQSDLLLPSPWSTTKAFFQGIQNMEILGNLLLTLKRVLYGLSIALVLGTTLGFLMGYSKTVYRLIDPVIGPIRQVPIMAWVPLTIIWLGLGDGPTLFIIAIVGIFPILLNTISGVQSISSNYINAARSMGARPWGLFSRIIFPASLPDILTGVRLAVSAGWMSVI
jgi:ABC-type nitrate/sulfonate/bicarbonate transport system permease component